MVFPSATENASEASPGFAGSALAISNSKAFSIWLSSLAFFVFASMLTWLIVSPQAGPAQLLSFDSAHYLSSAQGLYRYFSTGLGSAELRALGESLLLDGPLLPLLSAIQWLLVGYPGDGALPASLIVMQCSLHGLNSTLVYALARRMGFSALSSLIPGFFYITYPPALLAAGRFLTEPLSTALLLILILSLSFAAESTKVPDLKGSSIKVCSLWLLGGFAAAWLALTKSALGPAAGLLIIFALVQSYGLKRLLPKAAAAVLSLFLGASFALAPFAIFTQFSLGRAEFMTQRAAGFNAACGSDLETDGWQTMPVSLYLESSFYEKPLAIISRVIKAEPIAYAQLVSAKLWRLFAEPWNDFRGTVLGLEPLGQTLLHRGLFLLGIAGLCLSLSLARSRNFFHSSEQKFLAVSCSLAVLGHLVYLPFEANSRYGFSAQAELCLLAFLFLSTSYYVRELRLTLIALLAVVLFAVPRFSILSPLAISQILAVSYDAAFLLRSIVCLVFVCIFVFSLWRFCLGELVSERAGRLAESFASLTALLILGSSLFVVWGSLSRVQSFAHAELSLAPGASLEKRYVIDRASALALRKCDWAAVLVDCRGDIGRLSVRVNESPVPQLEPLACFDLATGFRYQRTSLHTIDQYARAARIRRDELKQWWVLRLPTSICRQVHEGNVLKIAIESGPGSLELYGSHLDLERVNQIPSLDRYSLTKLQAGVESGDGRSRSFLTGRLSSAQLSLGGSMKEMQELLPKSVHVYVLAAIPGSQARESEIPCLKDRCLRVF